MRKVAIAVAMFLLVLAYAAPAGAAEHRSPSGCAAFGANVAHLATTLRADFGATASSVASLAPEAFPTLVVFPEQAELCAAG